MLKLSRLVLAIVLSAGYAGGGHAKPDIVVFLTDDHSKLDSTVYGDSVLHTPNMQKLADAGMTFDNAYVASPTCAPSRAALLTALMPARNGAEANHSKPRPEIKKWPAYFQELGYEVVAFGKISHYKHTADYGFDYFAHDTFHDHEAIPAAVKYLEERDKNSTRPLCLMVGANWPHVPWPKDTGSFRPDELRLPDPSIGTSATRHARAQYTHAIEKADTDLGSIFDASRSHLGKDTVFLMSADHGAQWPFAKWNCYEAGLAVPLIVSWPGVTKPGSRTAAMVSWVDFLPTLLEVAGGTAPDGLDGKSFAPVLRDQAKTHRSQIMATHSSDGQWNIYPMRSLREGKWKYIRNLQPEFAFTTHIDLPGELGRMSYWKTWQEEAGTSASARAILDRYHQRPPEELYNLESDPSELRNLAADAAHTDQLKLMRERLTQWMREQGDTEKVYGTPRLLTDKTAYGPDAVPVGN